MRACALVLVALLSGCLIEPPPVESKPDAGSRPDSGVIVGWDAGGGGYGDGGYGGGPRDGGGGEDGGPAPTTSFPGSGQGGDPGTGVLWLVRIDRGTANLADSYAALIRGMTAQLSAEGFDVRMTGVASLYESRLYWSKGGKELAVSDLRSLLENAAASTEGSAPSACSTAALAEMGSRLNWASVSPVDYSTPSGGSPFSTSVGALLVVVLDHGARPVAYGSSSCGTSGMTPADWFGGSHDPAAWLNRSSYGWTLPRSQTRFLFVGTSESESYQQLRERCAAMSNFPRTALDAIGPSSTVFYSSFSNGLNNHQAGLGTWQDLCTAVAGDWTGFSSRFAKDWAELLRLPADQR
ncbi:hypothetical protein [Archangium lansingense]|uniref:Lipoprotein n=1 Tax=Archangium lansingense TaxID=2995310 RepID=A0ABT4A106_9BACT|nr:hypothetical protein [Archangium lansinium]MCY1075314.1 hypothetical protein [Archangium lansinium]